MSSPSPQFRFNPITGQLDLSDDHGSGPGGNIEIIPDDGASISAQVFSMFGKMAGSASPMTTTNEGGILEWENRTWGTPYVIDPSTTPGLRGTFATIQAALDAAVIDGMTYTNPKIFLIRPGSYIENLTIPGGSYFLSYNQSADTQSFIQPTSITGAHTCADIGTLYSQGISWIGGASDIFTSGSTFLLMLAEDSTFTTAGISKYVNCSAQAGIQFRNCNFGGATGNSQQKFSVASGSLLFQNCQLNGAGLVSGAAVTGVNCTAMGQMTFSAGTINLASCQLVSDAANITFNAASTGSNILNCQFISNSGTDYAIEGTHANLVQTIGCRIEYGFTGPKDFYDPSVEAGNVNLSQTGNVINAVVRTNVDYNATGFEGYIGVTDTSAARSVILGAGAKNYMVYVADESGGAGTNNITVTVNGGGTINGGASDIINSNYGGKLYFSIDGSNYIILAINSGGGGGITSLTPRTGGAISTSNIPVEGYLAGATQVVDTFNDSGTLRVADQTFPTRYVVDPSTTPGLMGTYQTINAAMTQAIADGWSILSTGVCTILIRTGSYTEDLVIPTNFAANFIAMSQSGLNSNTSDVTINGSITHQIQSYALFRNIAINPPATDGVIIDDGIYGAFYTDCMMIGGTNSALQFLGNTQPFIAENCAFLGPIETTSTSTAGNLDNCATFYNCSVASLSNYAGAGKLRFFNCQVAQCNMSDTAGVALYNCEATGNITGSGTGDCRVYDTVFLFNGAGVTCFDHAGSVEYSNVTCTNGSTLYSTNPTRIFQPNSQGNILNKTLTATDYTVLFSDYLIAVTSTAAARTMTLPDPTTISTDQSFIIKDQSGGAGTNNITITPAAGLVDGVASAVININYGSVEVYSDGANYFTI